MEEQQIQAFVHRVTIDEIFRCEFMRDPLKVILSAGFSARVTCILLRMVPHLAFEQPLTSPEKWWHV
jgi:hypothetical protein